MEAVIPRDVLNTLPKTSLVRRLYENDPKLGMDLTAVARSKAFARLESTRQRLVAEKKL